MFKMLVITTVSVITGSVIFTYFQHNDVSIFHMNTPFEAISSVPFAYSWYNVKNIHIYVPLWSMAVSSFVLWSYWTPLVGIWDVTSMVWLIVSVTLSMLPIKSIVQNRTQIIFNVFFLMYLTTISFMNYIIYIFDEDLVINYDDKLYSNNNEIIRINETYEVKEIERYYSRHLNVPIGVCLICSIVSTIPFHFKSPIYISGVLLVVLGFIMKVLFMQGLMEHGTGVFHLLVAGGVNQLLKV